MSKTQEAITEYCRREFLCDAVRFTRPGGRWFLVIGYRRITEEDPGQWYRNGEPYDFDYLAETVVASGGTLRELWDSARAYNRLLGLTMEEYLPELAPAGKGL